MPTPHPLRPLRAQRSRLRLAAVITAALTVGVGVAGVSASTATTTPSDDTTTVAATSAPTTPSDDSTATTPAAGSTAGSAAPMATGTSDADWERVVPGGDCQCSDGSEYAYYVRTGDPTKVVFMLEGGGACWDEASCEPTSSLYDPDVSADDDPAGYGGIFDLVRPDNPFADWSIVFVPYCSGDVHLGNATHEYAWGTMQHQGAANATAALDGMVERFPDATQVVVAGASAGSIATPLYAGLAQDRYPDAQVTAFGDGSGGYPRGDGALNTMLAETWGIVMPEWPVMAEMAPEDWNFTEMWIMAGQHAPNLRLARFDFSDDAVQNAFIGLVGASVPTLLESELDNEAEIESSGLEMDSYTAPGGGHTLLFSDELYDMSVGDVMLVDWMTQVANGDDVDDVSCGACESPTGSVPADTATGDTGTGDTAAAMTTTSG